MVRIYVSSVIDAAADTVWSRIRDFNALPLWHPGIADSRIEAGERSDQVGCVRSFTLKDGNRIREQLLTLDDRMPLVVAVEVADHSPDALDGRIDDGRASDSLKHQRREKWRLSASNPPWNTPWPMSCVSSFSRPSSQSNSALHSAKLRPPSVMGVSFNVAT